MSIPAHIRTGQEAEQETWFLDCVSASAIPFEDLVEFLRWLLDSGRKASAGNLADVLQDAMAEKCMLRETVRLLVMRQEWTQDMAAFQSAARKTLEKAFRNRQGLAYLKNCGLDKALPFDEVLRRLTVLLVLKQGIMCYEKTWGFGVVVKSDEFYEKVEIDFDKKRRHQLSFAYAAETLEIVRDDHLLAMRRVNPENLRKLIAEDQAEVVRIAIRSFGYISINRLRELLAENAVVPESDWKTFWEGARKGLKNDPSIDIPQSREAPIRMLSGGVTCAAEFLKVLKTERDPEEIISLFRKLEESAAFENMSKSDKDACEERIAFAMKAVRGKNHAAAATMLMTAKRLGLTTLVDVRAATLQELDAKSFLAAAGGLPQRDAAKWIRHLGETDAEKTVALVLEVADRLPLSACGDAFEYVAEAGRRDEIARRLAEIIKGESVSVDLVCWLCKNQETVAEWRLASLITVLLIAVMELRQNYSAKRLQAQKQLRGLFEQAAWLKSCAASLSAGEREFLLSAINSAKEWDENSRRQVMAELVTLYPELRQVLAGAAEKEERHVAGTHRFTSWRSYKARAEQLRKLIEEDLPKNSKEIAVARSYGDLRENAEYKAAKEHQALLFRRREQWELDLAAVKPTDFSESPKDVAGMGTRVVARRDDGASVCYNILGEWDGDEELGIISSKSDMAMRMVGRKNGDDILLPGAAGEDKYRVVEVSGLPADVKDWIRS